MADVAELKARFSLQPHPEGGFYAETYRSELRVSTPFGERSASTAINFLITPEAVSRMHRLKADECWHFYLGGPMQVVELHPDGEPAKRLTVTTLGSDVLAGQCVQHIVRANTWFGSLPCEGSGYSFVGCTVAPGFEFVDFELGSRASLLAEYEQTAGEAANEEGRALISKLTEGLP